MKTNMIVVDRTSSVLSYYIRRAVLNSLVFILPILVVYFFRDHSRMFSVSSILFLLSILMAIFFLMFLKDIVFNKFLICKIVMMDDKLLLGYFRYFKYKEEELEEKNVSIDIGKTQGILTFDLYNNGKRHIRQNIFKPWTTNLLREMVYMLGDRSIRINYFSDSVRKKLTND